MVKGANMNPANKKLTLDQAVTYKIKVQGYLDKSWSDWIEIMNISVESKGNIPPVTTITGTIDQAALQGLLRRLYSLGLPLISVKCVDFNYNNEG